MDVSDPQTLGFMVFGGFMIISAVGIALVSTLSMKETSYEEALATQRRQLVQAQTQRAEKKKNKTLEKKNKNKKKEDRPDEKLSEPGSDGGEEPEVVTCTEPESDPEPAAEPKPAEPEPKPAPEPEPEPIVVSTTSTSRSAPAPSPKEKKKKKSAKVEAAAAVETVAKEVLVMATAPALCVPPVNVVVEVAKEPSAIKTEDPKETSSKKKKSKNKPEPVTDSADSSPLLPFGELLSAVTNVTLSGNEMHKLMEVLNQKAGVHQDSWQLACQKGDPLSALKKQLEEKNKLLTAEQEDAAAAKNRLRELSKELGAEKSKMASLETRLKAELSARGQEVGSLQARLKTADQEHLKQAEQLNQKIRTLQDQLEKGPNAQLARLQQENSILRDALNQATSQAESSKSEKTYRQNAELACLRQDCARLGRELTERTDALRTDEERRKSLENKMATAEKELAKVQRVHADTERALQQQLEEVCSELKASQQEVAAIKVSSLELQGALVSREAELQELKVQLENQAAVQVGGSSEAEQLKIRVQHGDERVVALEAELAQLRAELQLLTSSQRVKEAEVETAAGDQTQKDGSGSETESEQPFESLEEDSQLLRLEEELQQLREELQAARNHGNELQEKLASSVAASSTAERLSEQREAELKAELAEGQSGFAALRLDFQASLQLLFPDVAVETEQENWLELFTQKVQESKSDAASAHSELQSHLNEAERKQAELQTEFDLNAKLLQKTEAEFQALQRRSAEEENVWRTKLSEAEEQKQTVLDQMKLLEEAVQSKTETENTRQLKEQLMLLEAQLEKQLEEASFSQSCSEELAQAQSQLQQLSARLQAEQEQRQQLDGELQQARHEVLQLQQQMEAGRRSAAPLEEATVEMKEETPV